MNQFAPLSPILFGVFPSCVDRPLLRSILLIPLCIDGTLSGQKVNKKQILNKHVMHTFLLRALINKLWSYSVCVRDFNSLTRSAFNLSGLYLRNCLVKDFYTW